MNNMQLSYIMKKKVREFLLNTQSTQDQQDELQQFLKNISPSLRTSVSVSIFSEAMCSNKVF